MTALPMTSLRLFFQDEPNYSDTIPKTVGDIDKEPSARKEHNKPQVYMWTLHHTLVSQTPLIR